MLQILVVTQSAKRRLSSRPPPAGTTSIINRATRPKAGHQHKKAQIKLEKMNAKLLDPQAQEIQASSMMTWSTVEHKEPHPKEEIKEEEEEKQQPQYAVIESKQSNTSD